MKKFLIILLALLPVLLSCNKESFITGKEARLGISADSLLFDTVFTTTGSVTKVFKLFNNNDQKLRLSEVTLAGGTNSPFKINIDGMATHTARDIELEANDSMYVFVNVSISANGDNQPFILSDSIKIAFNGNETFVQLQAWGRNARFLRNHTIGADEVWDNTRPYVILGPLQVDTAVTLTILEGTQVYLHADAAFIVDGTLKVKGTKKDSVVFRGDRLDETYRDLPGSWPGIIFRGESKENELEWTHILNSYQALIVDGPAPGTQPKLRLRQCVISNIYDAGILAQASSVEAENCLITNCGSNISLELGGDYRFTHCTIASYGNNYIQHKTPVVRLLNHAVIGGTEVTVPLYAGFTNCIFWGENGNVDNEIFAERKGTTPFEVNIRNCLYKAKTENALFNVMSSVKNTAPAFDSINTASRYYNFRLKEGSPALNIGAATGIVFDLDGNNRQVGPPDAGCYEKQ
ncbi:hypothetical protein [Parasegetibacter sp. NRK P23]|uniref:hypothetical protein n=1 Tax=Parasegetibacter sp. NRK P23 TaxID=2942999 RepID=UPI002044310F|nr:hypothetical protein [Parasegetibacter sp. NRK P23]MCM5529466.1 hypothetical protein [Parasegetibacter sp. NRK P23]